MMEKQGQKDLYVLVADLDLLQTMEKLLNRSAKLGIRPIDYAVAKHLHRDAGCRTNASQYMRSHIRDYQYALVMFDKEGCGDNDSREKIQHKVERDLAANGWDGRSKAVVIDPELETWVWTGSNHVPKVLGWECGYEELKAWLAAEELWPSRSAKPLDPKRAMRAALRKGRRSVSAKLFGQLAKSTTLRHCQDSAFRELRDTLQDWFPAVRP